MNDSDEDPTQTSALNSADPVRNFSLSVGERIRAITIGAPAYATRKKHIEDLEERHVRTLVALHDALVATSDRRDAAAVTAALLEKAATLDVKKMSSLIASHNRYYPIEANLPVDPRTGEYLVYGRRWEPEEPWTPARMVERALAFVAARDER